MAKNTSTPNSAIPASFNSRLLAQNIDLVLMIAIGYGLNLVILENSFFYPTVFIAYFLYDTAMNMSNWRGSVGKRLVGIQVKVEGDAPERIIMRGGLKFVSAIFLFGGFIYIHFNADRQAFHDKIARSRVVFT